MSKTAEIIKKFCEENEDKYSFYENYSGRGMFGKKCVGIIVACGNSPMSAMMELTAYLNDYVDELDLDLDVFEGASADDLGMDTIVYFPFCQG